MPAQTNTGVSYPNREGIVLASAARTAAATGAVQVSPDCGGAMLLLDVTAAAETPGQITGLTVDAYIGGDWTTIASWTASRRWATTSSAGALTTGFPPSWAAVTTF